MDILSGIAAGYFAALAVHFFLSYLISREGRGVLMSDGGMSRAYYLQLGLSWMAAGAAGALAALHFLPQMPAGGVALGAVAGLLCLALVRVRNKVPHQQTMGDTLLLLLCVLVGFGVPAYLRLN